MPRYMRETPRRRAGAATASVHSSDREPAAAQARGDQEREPDVDDDRGRDVARRVALVDRQLSVEAGHARALAVHDQAREPVGRDLDQDRADDERDDPPAAQIAAPSATSDHERRDERDVADRRADVRGVVERRGCGSRRASRSPTRRRSRSRGSGARRRPAGSRGRSPAPPAARTRRAIVRREHERRASDRRSAARGAPTRCPAAARAPTSAVARSSAGRIASRSS